MPESYWFKDEQIDVMAAGADMHSLIPMCDETLPNCAVAYETAHLPCSGSAGSVRLPIRHFLKILRMPEQWKSHKAQSAGVHNINIWVLAHRPCPKSFACFKLRAKQVVESLQNWIHLAQVNWQTVSLGLWWTVPQSLRFATLSNCFWILSGRILCQQCSLRQIICDFVPDLCG